MAPDVPFVESTSRAEQKLYVLLAEAFGPVLHLLLGLPLSARPSDPETSGRGTAGTAQRRFGAFEGHREALLLLMRSAPIGLYYHDDADRRAGSESR